MQNERSSGFWFRTCGKPECLSCRGKTSGVLVFAPSLTDARDEAATAFACYVLQLDGSQRDASTEATREHAGKLWEDWVYGNLSMSNEALTFARDRLFEFERHRGSAPESVRRIFVRRTLDVLYWTDQRDVLLRAAIARFESQPAAK
jgi:hypothetical protein